MHSIYLRGDSDTFVLVRDYGPMRPTLVYNCHFMPSICKNVQNHIGYLPNAGSEVTYHLDTWSQRGRQRGNAVCPSGWTAQSRANGNWRCPEDDQPSWQGYSPQGQKIGPTKAVLSRKVGENGQPSNSHNRLAQLTKRLDTQTGAVTEVWREYGALMTCDEFPAKRYVSRHLSVPIVAILLTVHKFSASLR